MYPMRSSIQRHDECMKLPGVIASVLLLASIASGQALDFDAAARRIVRLPPSAFPLLPGAVVKELERRGCTIPQEGIGKKPSNVIRGHFAKPGQTDWAVLCSLNGSSAILVFWNGAAADPGEVARREDRIFLQGIGGDEIAFSRSISVVGSGVILTHYKAYGGPTPPPLDHQGIDDSFLEKASSVHYFFKGKWLELTGSD